MDDLEISEVPVKPTSIEIEEGGALYIHMPDNGMPPQRFYHHMAEVKREFEEMLPGVTIIIGRDDLKFTTITSKQVFSQKLAGNI